ncbi:MAG: Flp pilus assembly protein CpaB [Thermacetogeniaceae bacterium]
MWRPRLMIVFSLVLAALAAVVGHLYLSKVSESPRETEMVSVVVAKKSLPANTLITGDAVEQKKLPVAYVHPHAARRVADVVGKIAREPLVAGEQVLLDRLVKQGDAREGFSYAVPPGKRAVSVSVDEVTAVGWHIKPGDHVDVLGTLEIPVSGGETKTFAVVALQDVEVLAVGKNLQVVAEQGKDMKTEVKTVTLAVSLDEAKPLILADEKGKIRLALRSPLDREKAVSPPFELGDFLRGYSGE